MNPIKSQNEFFTESGNLNIISEFKKLKRNFLNVAIVISLLICTNFYTLYMCSKIFNSVNNKDNEKKYIITKCTRIEPKYTPDDDDMLYTESPNLNTANSKQVVNLLDFQEMNDETKDNIFNNIDSIIVTDGDEGTSRHQISKVNWLFDEADTMLLYTALGEVFALASNGTISTYNTVNGARRLLQTNLGWLEGKISDVLHHGPGYKDMIERGKDYMKTREKKIEVTKITKDLVDINDKIIEAEVSGESTIKLTKQLEILQIEKEIVQAEKDKIPIVVQKPIEEQSLDMFMQQKEIERLEKQFDETKADEVIQYRDEMREENDKAIRILVADKYEVIRELNETKYIKSEEMDAIKYELDKTKSEIEDAQIVLDQLIKYENNVTKIERMEEVSNKLSDTNGKLSFTQLKIEEDLISMYDTRLIEENEIIEEQADRENEIIEEKTDRNEILEEQTDRENEILEEQTDRENEREETQLEFGEKEWTTEISENISKSCSIIKEKHICVCTDKETRDVYRC